MELCFKLNNGGLKNPEFIEYVYPIYMILPFLYLSIYLFNIKSILL